MKVPKKSVKKPVIKAKSADLDSSKKTKLKPISSKDTKNWKTKLDDEDDDFDLDVDEIHELDHPVALDDEFEDEDDRY
jgi:hypothetical protein